MLRLLPVALAPGALGHALPPQSEKAAAADSPGTLTIGIRGLKTDEGALMVALSNSEADYSSRSKTCRSAEVEITDGFSNNARRRFGPANWDEARFSLQSEQMKIEIEVK